MAPPECTNPAYDATRVRMMLPEWSVLKPRGPSDMQAYEPLLAPSFCYANTFLLPPSAMPHRTSRSMSVGRQRQTDSHSTNRVRYLLTDMRVPDSGTD
eukprot:1364930-Rhodomonas_salina.2